MSAALRRPTESGQLLRQVLFFVPAPLPVVGIVALVVGGDLSAPGWTILLAGSVAVASLLLALMVQPTPLPEGLSAEASVRRSLHRFRQITALRIALALTPVAVGAGASIAGGGLFPLLAALALAWPQLVLAAPTFFTITRARRAMEGWGTRAYLWAALAQPAPVEWPFATALLARYRARQAAREGRGSPSGAAPATAAAGGAEEDAASSAGAGPEDPATDSGLPDRLAVTSEEPPAEPSRIIPGFPGGSSGGASTTARRVPRQSRAARRKNAGQRPGGSRPKAKN
ncbi:hypothetical protein FZ103_20915 [Streptomonospora sp. PA3]|uniref:hypothetical protein n=1 Tax=Streptomonospora sp. PA3 TaxID=2607326 RepID=UPI0012DE5954|nr:hypothetical protein [Streptomonospora sp. PA3]MUL43601.1 hypothetical protein [Streptomonospora sp. PA3]